MVPYCNFTLSFTVVVHMCPYGPYDIHIYLCLSSDNPNACKKIYIYEATTGNLITLSYKINSITVLQT